MYIHSVEPLYYVGQAWVIFYRALKVLSPGWTLVYFLCRVSIIKEVPCEWFHVFVSFQLQQKLEKLSTQLNEEKQVCFWHSGLANLFFQFSWCYMYFALRPISLSLQMNKCLSDNQRLWKDRVTMLEEKIDITIKQKEKVTAGHFWRRQNFESSSNFFEFLFTSAPWKFKH